MGCSHPAERPPYCSSAAVDPGTLTGGGLALTTRSSTVLKAGGICGCEYLVILVSGSDDACAEYRDRSLGVAPDHIWLQLQLSASPQPGVYSASTPVSEPFGLFAALNQFTSGAQDQSVSPTAGTVSILSISDTDVQGSYDLTFSAAEHFSGGFAAPYCHPCK
jgi:hypothetical protein